MANGKLSTSDTTLNISLTDANKLRRAYAELANARFNNISVKDMIPLVMTISLLSEVIQKLDAEASVAKTKTTNEATK